MTHELKILPQYFAAVENGKKTFEVRAKDRLYAVGDTLCLKEWKEGGFTGRELSVEVTYILDDGAFCKEGFAVLGFRPYCPPLGTGKVWRYLELKDIRDAEDGEDVCALYPEPYKNVSGKKDDARLLPCIEDAKCGKCRLLVWRLCNDRTQKYAESRPDSDYEKGQLEAVEKLYRDGLLSRVAYEQLKGL